MVSSNAAARSTGSNCEGAATTKTSARLTTRFDQTTHPITLAVQSASLAACAIAAICACCLATSSLARVAVAVIPSTLLSAFVRSRAPKFLWPLAVLASRLPVLVSCTQLGSLRAWQSDHCVANS